MIPEKLRFFSAAPTGQHFKQDWSKEYSSPYPVLYRNELMEKYGLHAKDGVLKEIFDRQSFGMLYRMSQEQPLVCVDLLSAYGDSFLASVHGMHPEEIFQAWRSEESSLSEIKPRRFPCRTLGVDISALALDYGKRAGIFDDILAVNVNCMPKDAQEKLTVTLSQANFVHLGAPSYIESETFNRIIDDFASGPDFGVLIVAFNCLLMNHHQEFKQCIVEKLRFVNCVAGFQRYLSPAEVEHYGVPCAYSTTWVMERPLR